MTILISAFYYLQWHLWLRCWRRRHRGLRYNRSSGVDNSGGIELREVPDDLEDEETVQARLVLYPELTISSVWVYVYGWGMLLFMCIHCLAGVNVESTCWWVLGMMALCLDELVMSGVGRVWVGLIAVGIFGAVASIWCSTLLDESGNLREKHRLFTGSQRDGWNFLLGVICPVVSPFIFFSLRPTIQNVTRDISRLCELAMPFMIVISLFVVLGTDSEPSPPERRLLNNSVMIETVAKFASTYSSSLPGDAGYHPFVKSEAQYVSMVFAPLAALWCVRMLIHSVIFGYVTEFLTAFVLVLSGRYCITQEYGSWSLITMGFSALSFIIVLLVRPQ